MKTAEDFRKSLGHADEGFARCVRQTLTQLEKEEDKPVKKKISLSLAIAMAVMLLTVTALAASQWGVLDFAQRQGANPTEDEILTVNSESCVVEDGAVDEELIEMTMEEALYQDGKLYLAVTVKPKQEKTIVCYQKDSPGYEYIKEHGFEQIVMLSMGTLRINSYSNQSKDNYTGVEVMETDNLEDGTLRMLIQAGYEPDQNARYSERMESAYLEMMVIKLVLGEAEPVNQYGVWASVSGTFSLYATDKTIKSIPEDAHDIAGYRGAIEYVSLTPYDDGIASMTIMMDMTRRENDTYWMNAYPACQVLDKDGNVLCETQWAFGHDYIGSSYLLYRATIPAEFVPTDGTFTLRLQNPNNPAYVYDVYTYTMK